MTTAPRTPEAVLRDAFAASAIEGTVVCSPSQQATLALSALWEAGYLLADLPASTVDETTRHGVRSVQFGQVVARVCELDGSILGITLLGRTFDGPGAERLAAELLAAKIWSDRQQGAPA
jgi:hypothetical protein